MIRLAIRLSILPVVLSAFASLWPDVPHSWRIAEVEARGEGADCLRDADGLRGGG